MRAMDGASPARLRQMRILLGTVTLLLAGLVLAKAIGPVLAEAQSTTTATVTGTVFSDRNGDGVRQPGEIGIGGVTVTDGVQIVATGEDGRYALELDTVRRITDLVYVTQPAGHAVGVDEFNTPRFYRDLGQLTVGAAARADFALTPDPAGRSSRFTFANVADPHFNPNMKEQMTEISSTGQDLAFVQVSGDLTDNATDAEFAIYRAGTAAAKHPVWPAVGNHEYFNRGAATYLARIENYRRHVGPEWYSFDRGNRHFLVLENNGAAPFEEQYEWARQDLERNAAGKQVVLLMHQPMNVPFGSPSTYDRYGELLERYDTELVLVGHEHSNDADAGAEFVRGAKHVQTNSSSYTIDSSPRGFRYVHMEGEHFDNPFRRYGVQQSLTINAPTPGGEVSVGAPGEVQVNAYDSSDEVRRVRYRLDGRADWHPLRASGEWTWSADWAGAAPAPGEHTLDVEATDDAGNRWTKSTTFDVTNAPPVRPRAGADWAQQHGDERHSGVARDAVDPRRLALAWSHRTPGTFLTGSPVIAGGTVYAATRDENGEGRAAVYAIELASGRRLWEFRTDISVHGPIAVADGVVYAQSLRSTLYALDARSGTLLWQREPAAAPEPNNQRTYGYYGVTVAAGKVLWTHQDRFGVGSQGVVAALDPKTGATIWQSPMAGSTMSDGTPVVADGRVYAGSNTADQMVAYDVADGRRLWTSPARLGNWQDGTPSTDAGRVFVGAANGLVARDGATGEVLWVHRSAGPSHLRQNATPATPAAVGAVVYMGFPDGRVTALDAASGSVIWNRTLPGRLDFGGVHSSPAVSGDTVYVGSNNGSFYALDRASGEIVWEREIGTWVGAGPAISGNAVVFGAWDGNLYAFAER